MISKLPHFNYSNLSLKFSKSDSSDADSWVIHECNSWMGIWELHVFCNFPHLAVFISFFAIFAIMVAILFH